MREQASVYSQPALEIPGTMTSRRQTAQGKGRTVGLPPGSVRDAIRDVMTSAYPAPLPLEEIQRRVELRLGRTVPRSSVRSGLQLKIPDHYRREERGYYSLAVAVTAVEQTGCGGSRPTAPSFTFGGATLHRADAFEWLASCPDCSIHGVVTDPPYGLVEYRPEQLEKMRTGRGGVWRIPPSFDGHARAPLPRFSVLSEDELAAHELFFRSFGHALTPKLVPGAHLMVASNPLLSHRLAYALEQAGLELRG